MSAVRDDHRQMILSPLRWPYLVLPLVRDNKNNTCPDQAYFAPPLGQDHIQPDEQIEIRLGNIFTRSVNDAIITYDNVDALLRDGWRVD